MAIAFHWLQTHSIDVHDYEDRDRELVFDVVTVDAFIAGVASKILDAERITQKETLILDRSFLLGTGWDGHDVRGRDLAGLPEILEYARRIEQARLCCLAALRRAEK